ncbi:MAG: rRNA maturation RNase YbeY [Clostridia bacterium]|nr:rRNA maturation RNase YbeY [Clostridia bacterium]
MRRFKIISDGYDFSGVAKAFRREIKSDCAISLEIIVVDEEEIKRLNREMRKVDAVTDVLSFPTLTGILGRRLSKKEFPGDIEDDGSLFLGSIAICEKRAREQAEEYGHSFAREMNYLAVHGVCHLLGYDHETEEDRARMRAMEEKILTGMGLTRE